MTPIIRVLLILIFLVSVVLTFEGQEIPVHLWSRGPVAPNIDYRCLGHGCQHRSLRSRRLTVHRPQLPPTSPVVVRRPVLRRQSAPFAASFTFPSFETRRECTAGFCHYFSACLVKEPGQPNFCKLINGFTGICCREAIQPLAPTGRNLSIDFVATTFPSISRDQFWQEPPTTARTVVSNQILRGQTTTARTTIQNQALRLAPIQNQFQRRPAAARTSIQDLEALEDELLKNHIVPERNSQDFSHQNFFGSNSLSFQESQVARKALQAFIEFAKSQNLSPEDIISGKFDIRDTSLSLFCGPAPTCTDFRYRTIDGTCNNLIDRAQGKAVSTFARLLPPQYADGINEPRRALDGSELPNPRLLSLTVSPDVALENNFYSLLLMQFGQFVDHDMSRAAITRTHNDMQISCCDEKVLQNPRLRHPACFSIPVPESDSFLRGESQSCINFVRSAPAINPKCRFGPREQLNQLSSYLDGNNIYGASEKEFRELRLWRGGMLQFSTLHNQQFPPMRGNTSQFNCQIPKEMNRKCFAGGDIRSNEVIDLVVLHTVWLREHNRVATALSQLNPTWNDETLYQEAKRIVVAEFQHIIYNEFLPLILGPKTMEHFRLTLTTNGEFSNAYNPVVDASILNEFSAAAYRLHSLVQGTLNLNTPDNRVVAQIQLRDVFSNPSLMYQNGVYEMRIAGLTGQAIHAFDNFFSKDITNHLFQIPGKRFGLDLVALNIQRGRDHGLPPYVKYREICGLPLVRTFDDLRSHFTNPAVVDVMEQHYRRVEDIDLFLAGTSERPLADAVVGPTFACIIGEQFRRVKEGDRFWYENGNLDTSFSPEQLVQLKQATMARILCDNSNIGIMQPWAFLMPSESNPKTNCDQLPVVDLNFWRQS